MQKFLLPLVLVFTVVVLTGCGSKEDEYIPENIDETFIEETIPENIDEQTEEPALEEIDEETVETETPEQQENVQ